MTDGPFAVDMERALEDEGELRSGPLSRAPSSSAAFISVRVEPGRWRVLALLCTT